MNEHQNSLAMEEEQETKRLSLEPTQNGEEAKTEDPCQNSDQKVENHELNPENAVQAQPALDDVDKEVCSFLNDVVNHVACHADGYAQHQQNQAMLAAWYHAQISFLAEHGLLQPEGVFGPRFVPPPPGTILVNNGLVPFHPVFCNSVGIKQEHKEGSSENPIVIDMSEEESEDEKDEKTEKMEGSDSGDSGDSGDSDDNSDSNVNGDNKEYGTFSDLSDTSDSSDSDNEDTAMNNNIDYRVSLISSMISKKRKVEMQKKAKKSAPLPSLAHKKTPASLEEKIKQLKEVQAQLSRETDLLLFGFGNSESTTTSPPKDDEEEKKEEPEKKKLKKD